MVIHFKMNLNFSVLFTLYLQHVVFVHVFFLCSGLSIPNTKIRWLY